jgi:uncharacterized protein (TIGR00369 family)
MPTDDIAAEWQAVADAHAAVPRPDPGSVSAEQARGRSGLQVMQALLHGELPPPHIGRTLDFTLVEVGPGRAVFQGTPQKMHLNPMGGIHGGWYATLLDSALGCAVYTSLPAGRGYTTGQLNLHIVRAATLRSGPLRAIGEVVHAGRQLATAEARLVGADGKVDAHGSTTCLVFDMPGG